jgi:hypothetical protein
MTRDELRADCARCAALCCVATTFDRSPDFGASKAAGAPCIHLEGHRCAIHARRVEQGFPGCLAYDCHGAGQYVTQTLLYGGSWRGRADAPRIFATFLRVCELHEMLALLEVASRLEGARPLLPAIEAHMTHLQSLRSTALTAQELVQERAAVERLLVELRRLLINS